MTPVTTIFAREKNHCLDNGSFPLSVDSFLGLWNRTKYLYDYEGNRTVRYIDVDNDGIDGDDSNFTRYSWDHRNRLLKVENFDTFTNYTSGNNSTQKVEYAYDYQNRLIHRTLDPDGSAESSQSIQQTAYVYDGNQIVLQFEKTGAAEILATDLKHRDLWGPSVDQLLAQENVQYDDIEDVFVTEDLFWALTDNLNTVRDLVSYDSGTDTTSVESHRVFDAFGVKKSETAAVDCVFGYTGKLFDDKSDLQNNLNRWYEPATGKWISKDPIAADMNLYRYVANNPMIYLDPIGLMPCTAVCREDQKPTDDEVNKQLQNKFNELLADKDLAKDPQKLADAFLKLVANDKLSLTYTDANPSTGPFSASAIKLCGRCVGTDKIEHFFKEGRMYYEIAKEPKHNKEWAIAWGEWTEGIYHKGMTKEMYDWLKDGKKPSIDVGYGLLFSINQLGWGMNMDSFGFGKDVDQKGPASPADLAANESGMQFWDDLIKGKVDLKNFDICKYVNDEWDHIEHPNEKSKFPKNGRGNAPPYQGK